MAEFKELIRPTQVIMITTRANIEIMGKEQEKDNMLPIAWHCPLSSDPGRYIITMGEKKFSYKLIKKSGVFCINFVSPELQKEVYFAGTNSGEMIDKFKETGLTKEECSTIDCPRIKEAISYMECEVFKEENIDGHMFIIGKVSNIEKNADAKKLFNYSKEKYTTTVD
ncbi:flavin reductase family protein [Nanoarchaeota archaeon]